MARAWWLVLGLAVVAASAAEKPNPLEPLAKALAESDDADLQRDVLRGMADALAGRRNVAAPPGWAAVYRKLSASEDAEVRERVLALSVLFGDAGALKALLRTAGDAKAEAGARARALE